MVCRSDRCGNTPTQTKLLGLVESESTRASFCCGVEPLLFRVLCTFWTTLLAADHVTTLKQHAVAPGRCTDVAVVMCLVNDRVVEVDWLPSLYAPPLTSRDTAGAKRMLPGVIVVRVVWFVLVPLGLRCVRRHYCRLLFPSSLWAWLVQSRRHQPTKLCSLKQTREK